MCDDSYSDEGLLRGGCGRSWGRGCVNWDWNRGWVGKFVSDLEELNVSCVWCGWGRGWFVRSEVVEYNRLEELVLLISMGIYDGVGSSNVGV